MRKTSMIALAVILAAGLARGSLICGDQLATIFVPPTDTIAQVDVLSASEVVLSSATVTPVATSLGLLEFTLPDVEYSFRLYDEGPTVIGSHYWDSCAPVELGCVQIICFGEMQEVVPEPASIALMVMATGGLLLTRRMLLI